jgi:hypothetical protein
MSQFLEQLKARLADSQQRLQSAQQALVKAQNEHQAVMQEYSSWQNAVSVETRREEATKHISAVTTVEITPRIISAGLSLPKPHVPAQEPKAESDVNKTTLIREVLRQNPNGITPANLWRAVKDRIARPYVYSVLKRLKDRKQVTERRGKYFLLVVANESKDVEVEAVQ